jgi:hypothetical protein
LFFSEVSGIGTQEAKLHLGYFYKETGLRDTVFFQNGPQAPLILVFDI